MRSTDRLLIAFIEYRINYRSIAIDKRMRQRNVGFDGAHRMMQSKSFWKRYKKKNIHNNNNNKKGIDVANGRMFPRIKPRTVANQRIDFRIDR